MLARAVAVVAIAAGAVLPAVAHAQPICTDTPYVCHDTDHPDCLLYGNLGAEAGFHFGEDCPPRYP
ncbi:MAG TPA: hypothetical protein VGX28_10510 [Frankiaceae bacterium]|jgi:hypothetical protein|nr:hypothetical protein [Frankiaceae bacterium]